MADLGGLAQAIVGARPGDRISLSALQEKLKTVAKTCCDSEDAESAEKQLKCVLDHFRYADATRREVLDQVLLEVLPHMAPMAALSARCAEALADFCSIAAEACPPHEMVTACLEVLDQLLGTSANAPALQFLCSFLELLPQLLVRLSRRTAAFITECLVPVSNLARVQGELLQGWLQAQLRLAADTCASQPSHEKQNSCKDILRRVDTFLAANWQLYEKFIRDVLFEALPGEADPAAQQLCKRAIGSLILQLLHHLTAAWPPPALTPLALQLFPAVAASAPAAQLPTAASVLPPTSMWSLANDKQAMPPADSHLCQQQTPEQLSTAVSYSDAVDVVQSLLTLLNVCGLSSWQALTQPEDDAGAAGAALAVLYSGCLCEAYPGAGCSYKTSSRVDMLKMACSWSSSLSEASHGNPLVVFKAIGLVQLAATQAATLTEIWSASAASGSSQPAEFIQDIKSASDAARLLLLDLEPCVGLLASSMASGGAVLRSQASLALQQLLRAAGPAVSYCCFKELLYITEEKQIHPELAAVLMQEVRMQLAMVEQGCDSPFAGWQSAELVLPWLQQGGATGWQDTEQLADRANAICAALAVVRLSLLREKGMETLPVAAASTNGTSLSQTKAELQQLLTLLSAAVATTLNRLRLLNSMEQGLQHQPNSSSIDQQHIRIPGEARGDGQAVDAWLAVSRVQDVLARVLELLPPTPVLA